MDFLPLNKIYFRSKGCETPKKWDFDFLTPQTEMLKKSMITSEHCISSSLHWILLLKYVFEHYYKYLNCLENFSLNSCCGCGAISISVTATPAGLKQYSELWQFGHLSSTESSQIPLRMTSNFASAKIIISKTLSVIFHPPKRLSPVFFSI